MSNLSRSQRKGLWRPPCGTKRLTGMQSLLLAMALEKVCHMAPMLEHMLPGCMCLTLTRFMAGTMLPAFYICVCLGGSCAAWAGIGSVGIICTGACMARVPMGVGARVHSVVTGVCDPSGEPL